MRRIPHILLAAAVLSALLIFASGAAAATGIGQARGFEPNRLLVKFRGEEVGRAVALPVGAGVVRTARALRQNGRVAYAEPDFLATASALPVDPDDPGTLGGATESAAEAGGWAYKQWNFLPFDQSPASPLPTSPGGIDAVDAWRNLIEEGAPGARGVRLAVLDTGIAYRTRGPKFRRSPDFEASQFLPGYDFVNHDRYPLDENGHGTHVAGTIAERTDNGVGLAGLAYRAKLMPVRVLDKHGRGDAVDIVRGLHFAIRHHAQVINMSFNFGCRQRVPMVDEALREAFAHNIVTVASAGNAGSEKCVSEPATGPHVIAVGGTTEGACLGRYSLTGPAIDVVAPGGGLPRRGCPSVSARPIYQVTLKPGTTTEFAIPSDYVGTSMAAAHVSGVAAMIIASNTLSPRWMKTSLVEGVTRRLRRTARSIGLPSTEQGAGLIDAARATEP
jgi:serine protease